MERLKPCPFCGGYANLEIEPVKSYPGWCSYEVVCMDCSTRAGHGKFYDDGTEKKRFIAKLKAIEAWNRRSFYDN